MKDKEPRGMRRKKLNKVEREKELLDFKRSSLLSRAGFLELIEALKESVLPEDTDELESLANQDAITLQNLRNSYEEYNDDTLSMLLLTKTDDLDESAEAMFETLSKMFDSALHASLIKVILDQRQRGEGYEHD